MAISKSPTNGTEHPFAGQAPKAVVAFEVSRSGVVNVEPSELLKTEQAKSQIRALKQLRDLAVPVVSGS